MRYLIFIFLFSCLFSLTPAYAQNSAPGDKAVEALTKYCLGPVADGKDPADLAVQAQLPEFPVEEAAKFSAAKSRVFGLPALKGMAVLMVPENMPLTCSIAIQKTDPSNFWKSFDSAFSSKAFRLLKERRIEEEKVTKREMQSKNNSNLRVLVTASDIPRPNGIQVLMTASQAKK